MPYNQTLKERVDELKDITGSGTELVSVTVPPDKNIHTTLRKVTSEHAQADNIKSDTTRKNVKAALKKTKRILQQYKQTPENGLVVYSGVVNGEIDNYVFDDLPRGVDESLYRCDDHFVTRPLEELVTSDTSFALVIVERGRAIIGTVSGNHISVTDTLESQVMGKSRAGGQSAARFERERERQTHEFYKKVAETVNRQFVKEGVTVDGIVVGGTIATAKSFARGDYLDHRLQNDLIGVYGVEYATDQGLEQLVEKADSDVLTAESRELLSSLDEFFSRLRQSRDVAYGLDEVKKAVEYGAVETLLIGMGVEAEVDENLRGGVINRGGEVLTVPGETDKGSRFNEHFSGVGALLRYPIN